MNKLTNKNQKERIQEMWVYTNIYIQTQTHTHRFRHTHIHTHTKPTKSKSVIYKQNANMM